MKNWRIFGAVACLVILGMSLVFLAFAGPGEGAKQMIDLSPFKTPGNTKFRILTFPTQAEVCQYSGQNNEPAPKGYTGTEKPPLDTANFSKITRDENGVKKEFVKFFIRLDGYQNSETFEAPIEELQRGVWRGGEVLRLTPLSKVDEARHLFPIAFWLVPSSLLGVIVFGVLAMLEVKDLKERERLVGEAGQDAYVGRFVRDYLVKRKLGGGAQGDVYLVRTKDGQELAMKVFENRKPKNTDTLYVKYGKFDEDSFQKSCERFEEDRERFLREARVRMKHPNVVEVVDAGEEGDFLWIVTTHYGGGSLKSKLDGKPLSDTLVLKYAKELCEGLKALHERSITHRDLKPENVMLDSEGRLVIIDMGLARDKIREKTITQAGNVMGTLAYMGPEQMGQVPMSDHRSDQYAYGFMLFEFLTGALPVPPDASLHTLYQMKNSEKFARLRDLCPEASEELENVILKMTRCEMDSRFGSVEEAHEAFEKAFRAWKGAS